MNKRIALFLASFLTVSSVSAQSENTPEIQTLKENMRSACPAIWEDLTSRLDPKKIIGDIWDNQAADKTAFIDYLSTTLGESSPEAAELEEMSKDQLTVAAECATQRVKLLQALMIQLPNDVLAGMNAVSEALASITRLKTGSSQQDAAASCKAIKEAEANSADGLYWIDTTDLADTSDAFQVYCDMTSEGGGWTLIVAQYEQDPVPDWNEGIQSDYDPSLETKKGFTLNTGQIPEHSEVAFGKDKQATFVDYVDHIYTTGNISKTLLAGKRTDLNRSYHLYRSDSNFYTEMDPERSTGNLASHHDALTFDQTGGVKYTWAFAPEHNLAVTRGYSILAGGRRDKVDNNAWTVWVR